MNHHHYNHHHHVEPDESPREYAKFAGVIAGIVLASLLLTQARGWGVMAYMADFMGVFFLVFAAFKLINLEMFVITYRSYDILARRLGFWGWIFPFVELALGAGYLLLGNNLWLNIATITVTAAAGIGVVKELRRKSQLKCACLGTVIRLPLSQISFVENFLMLAMAVVMILL